MAQRPRFDVPIAHRGLHDAASGVIENSRTAFARAIAAGYAIECDLQLTGDDVPVVFHDDTLERLTGHAGAVRTLSAGQLARLPLLGSADGDAPQRFSELLDQVQGDVPLVVELKHQPDRAATEALAAAAVRETVGYDAPLVFESFDPDLLRMVRKEGFSGPVGIVLDDFTDAYWTARLSPARRFALRHLLHYPRTRFSFLSVHHRALRLPAVRLFRKLGFPVTTWTVRSPDIAVLSRAHADQIVFEGFQPHRA